MKEAFTGKILWFLICGAMVFVLHSCNNYKGTSSKLSEVNYNSTKEKANDSTAFIDYLKARKELIETFDSINTEMEIQQARIDSALAKANVESVQELIERMELAISNLSSKRIDSIPFDFRAWGAEPFWYLELNDSTLIFNDSSSFRLVQEIENVGFSLKFPKTFHFLAEASNSSLILIINKEECEGCSYDNSEGESELKVQVLIADEYGINSFLGCGEFAE